MDKAQKKSDRIDRLTLMALIVVVWPGVVWYLARMFDHSDEPCGSLALVSLCALAFWRSRDQTAEQIITPDYAPMVFALLTYTIAYAFAPHLCAALLLIFVLWFVLVDKVPPIYRTSFLGLAALSLPLISSLNFYAGYPLRLCIAAGSCLVLNLLGLATKVDGVMLSLHSHQVAIDAPCSGVGMLWTSIFVAMLCAVINSLKTKATILLTLIAIFLVIAGNIWRATTLVMFDSLKYWFSSLSAFDAAQLEPAVHLGVGVCAFLGICALTIFASFKLEKNQGINQAKEPVVVVERKNRLSFQKIKVAQALIPLCLVAAIVPIFAAHSQALLVPPPSVIFPSEINGNKVLPVQTLGEEQAFARNFPGQMKRFTDGRNAYFVRVVFKETRQLHPSSDCFRGMGYSVEPGEIKLGANSSHWSSFEANKNGQKYLVMERVVDISGQSWSDVSAWYWSVLAGKTNGPWTAITIARRII